jgi:pimeloyl-ACP methyl ester carboxylesterase
MLIILVSILLACIIVFACVLQLWSYPGRPAPFLDESGHPLAGSISEKVRVEINGVEQGMFIKGKDVTKPVLLYLHGGMPDYFLTPKYPTDLEEHFVVVWWEQRGIGISYSPDISRETLTVEQYIADTLAVTNYLRERFGREKIYLMGHSGGTFFGIQAAARTPELYYAYIGLAQMSDQLTSEVLAYDYMLAQFRENGDTKMVRKLEAAPVTQSGGVPDSYRLVRDVAMHRLGVGTTHDMTSIVSGILLPSLQFREYTFNEKMNLWRGKAQSGVSVMWEEVLVTDLAQQLPAIDLPVYFLHGIHDYTCAYSVARSYFEQLQAPVKGFYTFEQSAHSPMFEEPEKMLKILQEDVLAGKNGLADTSEGFD